jgi:hypothetical protein
MDTGLNQLPRTRREGLNVHAVGSEVLLFDPRDDTAHALNKAAAFVWQRADGTRTVEDMAREMTREFGAPADAETVWYALEQLDKRGLMETRLDVPAPWRGMTRRQFLTRAAGGAVLLAVISSIVAPTPAHAQTGCVGVGQPCTNPTDCCIPLNCCFSTTAEGAVPGTCQVICGV